MPLQIQIIDGMIGDIGARVFITNAAGIPAQYDSGAIASAEVEIRRKIESELESIPPKRFRIVKVEAENSDFASKQWRTRELSRFESGYYERVPWADESWYKHSSLINLHHCHMSRDKSAMVAFTESEEKGIDDKQKRMRAGRYLTQYFESTGIIDDIEVRYWAGKLSIAVGGDSDLLRFAYSPDDIEEIYTTGPHSCMANEADHYQGSCHPVRIYGAGDLAVAYIERESSIAARVLCYPEHKVYSTVYGDGGVWTEQLKGLLASVGYEFSSDGDDWSGARMLRIEHGYGIFVVPYLDIPGQATDDGEFLRVSSYGEIACDNEHGVSEESGRECENCNERYDDEDSGGSIGDSSYCDSCYCELSFYCEDCDETGFREDGNYIESLSRDVCDSCVSNYPSCDSCHERHSDQDSQYVAAMDKTFCDSCYDDECATCGECGESDSHSDMIERIDGEQICGSCAESMVQCIECNKYDESVNCYTDDDGDQWCDSCRQESLDLESDKESE